MKIKTDRVYNKIIIHCSDSDRLAHDNAETIKKWHMEREFRTIGYHYVCTKTRGIELGRDLTEIGAHTKGYNANSIGICLTGNKFFTQSQFEETASLCHALMQTFGIKVKNIHGHNEFNLGKTCPNFRVGKEIRSRVQDLLIYSRETTNE